MRDHATLSRRLAAGALAALLGPVLPAAWAEPQHALAMVGEPALPPGFAHLPYVNPDAPQGGRVVTAEVGTFDSLNPYIVKGTVPWEIPLLITETLMGRSLDEPFTLYPLLAESVETAPDRSWVEFHLNPEARFSDGTPVTVEDVIWSYETLGTQGQPRYLTFWDQVASMEPVGERGVRIAFNTPNRELALLAGLRPILKKAQYEGLDFAESGGLDVIPITSAPYVIEEVDAGRSITLRRDPDYWGAEIPFRVGTQNLEEIRIEFFADETAAFEAFKAGEITLTREVNVAKWESEYDFPLVQEGAVTLSVIPNELPTGFTGLAINTRNPHLADWRVRDALLLAFNFEFINEAVTGGSQERITSYFSNSDLAMGPGPAEGRVAELLEPYADDLPPGAMEGYELPVGDGTERNRAGIAAASERLAEAGWTAGSDGVLRNAAGEPFSLEILLQNGATEPASVVDIYVEALRRLGIQATVTSVDAAQYKQRTDAYDFDMTWFRRAASLAPGNEQTTYWGSALADEPGGRNLIGIKSPAIDGTIRALLSAETAEDYAAAAQALDRVLAAGRYVIPFYQPTEARIAHASDLRYPERLPLMGDAGGQGWQPDVWWHEPQAQ